VSHSHSPKSHLLRCILHTYRQSREKGPSRPYYCQYYQNQYSSRFPKRQACLPKLQDSNSSRVPFPIIQVASQLPLATKGCAIPAVSLPLSPETSSNHLRLSSFLVEHHLSHNRKVGHLHPLSLPSTLIPAALTSRSLRGKYLRNFHARPLS
jgi:hypothetical protein